MTQGGKADPDRASKPPGPLFYLVCLVCLAIQTRSHPEAVGFDRSGRKIEYRVRLPCSIALKNRSTQAHHPCLPSASSPPYIRLGAGFCITGYTGQNGKKHRDQLTCAPERRSVVVLCSLQNSGRVRAPGFDAAKRRFAVGYGMGLLSVRRGRAHSDHRPHPCFDGTNLERGVAKRGELFSAATTARLFKTGSVQQRAPAAAGRSC